MKKIKITYTYLFVLIIILLTTYVFYDAFFKHYIPDKIYSEISGIQRVELKYVTPSLYNGMYAVYNVVSGSEISTIYWRMFSNKLQVEK